MLKIGDLVRNKRRQAGLTQEALAEKAGISSSYVAKIEIGLQEPGTKVLLKLVKVLGIESSEIMVEGELLAEINMLADKMGTLDKRFGSLHPRVKAFLLEIAPTVENFM